MKITLDEAVDMIVEDLAPAKIPRSDLRVRVRTILQGTNLEDQRGVDMERDAGPQSSSQGTHAAASKFVRSVQAAIKSYQELPPYLQAKVDLIYYDITNEMYPDFARLLQKMVFDVDNAAMELFPPGVIRRSGGSTLERELKQEKMLCAKLAAEMILRFHVKPMSAEYGPYVSITGTIYNLWTGIEDANVRRACSEYYRINHAQTKLK